MQTNLSYHMCFVLNLAFLIACSSDSTEIPSSEGEPISAEETTEEAKNPDISTEPADTGCQKLSQSISEPFSIKTFTDFINSFDLPISVPCVVENLPAETKVLFTSSTLSVQPAKDEKTPRIFFKLGPLYISVSALEAMPNLIELSEELESGFTVKGELAFPIKEKIDATSPYSRILNDAKTGTTCAACHGDEGKAPSDFPDNAYFSIGLKAFERQVVSVSTIIQETKNCAEQTTFRCKVLESMDHMDFTANSFEFPKHFKTMF